MYIKPHAQANLPHFLDPPTLPPTVLPKHLTATSPNNSKQPARDDRATALLAQQTRKYLRTHQTKRTVGGNPLCVPVAIPRCRGILYQKQEIRLLAGWITTHGTESGTVTKVKPELHPPQAPGKQRTLLAIVHSVPTNTGCTVLRRMLLTSAGTPWVTLKHV